MQTQKPGLLFLCVANSARSQMAEGLARNYLGNRFKVFSAGSSPESINPNAILVMKEIGIDISHQYPKSIDSILGEQIHLLITLCTEEPCPIFSRPCRKIHWPLINPAKAIGTKDEILEVFRSVRDDIFRRIKAADFSKEISCH